MNFPMWTHAAFWGGVAGSALLVGAVIGYYTNMKQRWIAAIMAFGSGVLISALTLELMDEAYRKGGLGSTGIGFIAGAAVYTAANYYLTRKGAKHRKRSQNQPSKSEAPNSGMSIAVGALLDGIPESIVVGLSLISGGKVSFVAVIAIFLSNIPEGLSSSSGMRKAGRGPGYVFGLWGGICAVSALAAVIGFLAFRNYTPEVVAATTASAAGAILAMLSDTMIPEAFETAHDFTGLITVAGFLTSYFLSKIQM